MGNKCTIASESCGFQCTGYDGAHRWKKLHAIVEGIECDTCRDHAVQMMKGLHDHVNAGLGEPIFDKKNYKAFVDEVACVHKSCVAAGRC